MAFDLDEEKVAESSVETEVPAESLPQPQVEQAPEETKDTPQGDQEVTFEVPAEEASVSSESKEVTPVQEVAPEKDEATKKLEEEISKDIKDIYSNLPDDIKPMFAVKGEEVTLAIKAMIDAGKFDPTVALGMFKEWLAMIPEAKAPFILNEGKKLVGVVEAFIEENTETDQNDI